MLDLLSCCAVLYPCYSSETQGGDSFESAGINIVFTMLIYLGQPFGKEHGVWHVLPIKRKVILVTVLTEKQTELRLQMFLKSST